MTSVISFLLFTALVAFVSYWKTRKDKMDSSAAYFLAGRSLSAWVIAGSLLLTNLSTEHLISLNADAFNHGIQVMAWETTAALAMVLTALFFLPRYLKGGLTTIPQFLASRFDENTRVITTALFLLSYIVGFLPVVLISGAVGLESLFNVSENLGISYKQGLWLMVWGVGTLGSLYAIFGGLKAVAISDTVNGIGFLVAGLLIPVLGLISIGDGSFWAGLTELRQVEHAKFDITGDEPGSFLPFGVLFTGMIINQIFFWCTNQSIVQRALGAKSLAEGQKGVLIAAGLKLLGPLIIILPGVIAYHMFKETLTAGEAVQAYPMLVKAVLPPALIGFFAAVMVGAILSTFNSVLNSSATLFSEGIFTNFINKNPSGRQIVLSGRITSVVLAIGAMLVAPTLNTSGSLYNYLQVMNAIVIGPILGVILLGMFTRHVSAAAAKFGLIFGSIAFILVKFVFENPIQNWIAGSWLGTDIFRLQPGEQVHFLHFLAFLFVLNVLLMLLISKLKPATVEYVETYTHSVDITPWHYARITGAAIAVITFLFYILLAQ